MFVFQGIFHDQESLFNRKRLFNEIKRSQPSGFYCGLDSAMSGDHDNGRIDLHFFHCLQSLETVNSWQPDI